MTRIKIKKILADHALWLVDSRTGKRANLRSADLSGSDLYLADLRGSDLRMVNLRGANLGGATGLPEAPTIENLDAKILDVIESPGNFLCMDAWHTCETTHCRAGWAITLAGEAGKKLEGQFGPSVAGALIYAASGSHPVPNFCATNENAMADMRKGAGR